MNSHENQNDRLYENKKRIHNEIPASNEFIEHNFLKLKLEEENKKFLSKNKNSVQTEIKLNSLVQARLLMKKQKNNDNINPNEQINKYNSLNVKLVDEFSLCNISNNKEVFMFLENIIGFKLKIEFTETHKNIEFFKEAGNFICNFQLIFDNIMTEESYVEYVPIKVNLTFNDEEDQVFCNERIHILVSDLPFIFAKFLSKI